jgi:hypothetical protein
MNIELKQKISFGELEQMIKNVRLCKFPEVIIYKNASISLREYSSEEVNPTTFYLLKKNITFQQQLREYLQKNYDIDTLHLKGALVLFNHDKQEQWTLTPPIIEVIPRIIQYTPQKGEISYQTQHKIMIPAINDGAHRIYTARIANESFTSLHIIGALEEYPLAAHPNNWSTIQLVDEVPATKEEKKMYTREDCYGLYRDFKSLGCGGPRNLGKEKEKDNKE